VQVDGFPPREDVLTVYVAHDIQAQKTDPTVLEYLANDEQIQKKGVSRDKCLASLQEIGFDDERLALNISALSGLLLNTTSTLHYN
jgi:elongation factor 3